MIKIEIKSVKHPQGLNVDVIQKTITIFGLLIIKKIINPTVRKENGEIEWFTRL
jgi:hypothetical protein